MYPELNRFIVEIKTLPMVAERQQILTELAEYIALKTTIGEVPQLNFICTHNSRRSQLAQVWAQAAAYYYSVEARCFSGGVEATNFNERAVAALTRAGFTIEKKGPETNPVYEVRFADGAPPVETWSKLYDDPANPTTNFAAIMTCAEADENCPFIPGADIRLPLRYDDPKVYDGTASEADMYDERSRQIAAEMFYVFGQIK